MGNLHGHTGRIERNYEGLWTVPVLHRGQASPRFTLARQRVHEPGTGPQPNLADVAG